MAELSAAQRADFTDAFSKLDRDGDGTVDTKELDTALQSLGQNPTDVELLDLINIVRGSGLKTMNLQAFLEEMARQVKATSRAPRMGKEIKEEFQIFDRNADGLISSGELREVMGMLGERDDVPYVHSVSYGNDEAQQSGKDYMNSCNSAFMKAGARGLSILFASGDQGVCGREGCGYLHVRFKPDFPAGSPYITAVGGTDFLTDDIGDETAWSASGGGFSDNFPIPDFQKDAVAGYKSSPDADLPSQSYWNNNGRGYPDIAALGGTKTPYCVATGGRFGGVAGTSASCPVAAGVFAKINAMRLSAGKPVMGFLNPFIYKNPKGFQDVTSGRNGAGRSKLGFKAIAGWDPATGLGTPDFEALSQLAMAAVKVPADSTIVV